MIRVERTLFLSLTAAIAAACSTTSSAPPIIVPESTPDAGREVPATRAKTNDETAGTLDAGNAEPKTSGPDPTTRACAEDDVGSAAACARWDIDPTCEHASRAECTEMVDPQKGFKPKVGERIAECIANKPVKKATGCKKADMHRCIRDAVDKACVEPEMTAACERLVDKCKKRRAALTFTASECAKIASSMGPDLRKWALQIMGGEHFNGTPMAEGCTLEYITIYQPWPKNWWTGK